MTQTRFVTALVLAVGLLQVGTARPIAQRADTAKPPQTSQQPDAAPAEPTAQAATPQQPTFRTGINFVRVDVIVTDKKAQPVMDLTQADFEVREDGKPQKIEQFRLIRVDGNPAPGDAAPREIRNAFDQELEAARDDVRMFVIFFDDYHTRLANALSVRDPLIRFIQTQLGPNDLLGIMYPLTPVSDLSLTRNHASIISAIQKFEGRKFRYEPRNEFEERYAQYPTQTVETIRNQVVMGALRGLATRLGSLREGRKAIIYVSEGLTAMLPVEMQNPIATQPGFGNPNARGRITPPSPREETADFFEQASLMSQLRDVFDAANRNNAAIYAVDPRGLATNEFDIDEPIGPGQDRNALQKTQDTLRSLSEETDGRAIVNRNDLSPGLAQIVRDSSAYYLIGYNSAQAPTDGKFHEIKVAVKPRPGMSLDVRARRGYWAATIDDVARATAPAASKPEVAKPIQQALASISSAVQSVQAGKYVRTWIGAQRGENGKTRMTLVWEPLPQTPGVRREQPGRVSVIAADSNGGLVFRGRAPDAIASTPGPPVSGASADALPANRPAPAAAALAVSPQRISFDAPPGPIELRLSVEGAAGGVLDSEIRDITVPDLGAVGLSTPRVYRARTVRELQTIANNADAVPIAAREFARTERVLVRFDVYGTGMPTASLLNRNGQKMADLPITAAPAGGTHQIDLGLSTVPIGEYLIEITVPGAPDKELLALRVTG